MEYKKALSKAMNICSRKEQCISDVMEKLNKWNVNNNNLDKIINTLIQEKFIDEERYAVHYVNDKIWLNKWGKRKVLYVLKLKRISEKIIDKALGDIDNEKYYILVYNELKKKHKKLKPDDRLIIKSKLYNFGSGRGYESDLIYKAVGEIFDE